MADEIDVRHVAKLARLALTDDEVERFGSQLGSLMAHVAELAKLPTQDVAATAQVIPASNVTRHDAEVPSLSREVFLEGAPSVQGPFVRVPRIIAEE
jgi:aspartyl-tRNA(Asn)/glutamyl-tRNA(Gln) amidotransferase subunit C